MWRSRTSRSKNPVSAMYDAAFGKDPEVRKLAEEIVKAQESEIGLMQNWLKKNGQ